MNAAARVITVRTFQSEEEIREVEGFIEGNLVTKDNYKDLLGDYRLPEKLSCCLHRDGRRCSARHNYGFVVILQDHTVSIVGNKCGNDKFGAESKLARDMRLYENEKARLEALRRLAEILAARESSEAQVAAMYEQLKALTERARGYLEDVGDTAAKRIRNMARSVSGRVTITGIRLRPYTDDDGREKFEKSLVDIDVGSLSGLSIFNPELAKSAQESLRGIAAAYREAEALDGSATTNTLSRITSMVSALPGVLDSGQRLLDAEKAFNEDWSCLPFLVGDKSECLRLVRTALAHVNNPVGKDRAKEWLSQKKAAIKAQYNVQELSW